MKRNQRLGPLNLEHNHAGITHVVDQGGRYIDNELIKGLRFPQLPFLVFIIFLPVFVAAATVSFGITTHWRVFYSLRSCAAARKAVTH